MTRIAAAVVLVTLIVAGSALGQSWPQFGGPRRDFRAEGTGLAKAWPASGPKVLWSRGLGEGYSGIASADGVLYTMYRPLAGSSTEDEEVVAALDAASGRTLWEHREPAAFLPSMRMEHGPGPHATPLVVGDRVFVTGVLGRLLALDRKTGSRRWSRDLWRDFGGGVMNRGYACSPLAWKDTVVVAVGGEGGLVAFAQSDGALRWQSRGLRVSPSSPVLIDLDGQEQLVFFAGDEVVGLDPATGARLWGHSHPVKYGLNIALPVWGDDRVLVVSSAYDGGTRALRLTRSAGTTKVEELWFTNRMRVHHGNLLRIGDHVYGSSGDFGPAPLTAVELGSGKVVWQDRAFSKATLVRTGERVLVLDEDGDLGLASLSPKGLELHAQARVLSTRAWTAPTLVGTRLYLRDRARIVALELGS
jgi:outer membrane protein assembly factor BamB